MKSISKKILLRVFVMTIVVTVGLSIFYYDSLESSLIEDEFSENIAFVDKVEAEFKSELEDINQDLSFLGQIVSLNKQMKQEQVRLILESFLKEKTPYDQVSFYLENDQRLEKISLLKKDSSLVIDEGVLLKPSSKEAKLFYELLYSESKTIAVGTDEANQGKLLVSKIIKRGYLNFMVSAAVFLKDIVGIKKETLPRDSSAFIKSPDGKLIQTIGYHKNSMTLIDLSLTQEKPMDFIDTGEFLVTAKQLRLGPDDVYEVVVVKSKDDLFSGVFLEMRKNLYLVVLTSLFLAIGFFYFIRKQLRPVRDLEKMVNRLVKNKNIIYSKRELSLLKRKDEIGILANSFYELVRNLLETNANLNFQKNALDLAAIVTESDPDGMITYVNSRFCEVTGYSSFAAIGNSHSILNSGYHLPEFFQDLWETINSGRVWSGEIRNRKKNGDLYWEKTSIVPCLKDGRIVKFISFRHDITQIKENEERLEEAMEAKSRFIAIMSHEIRTPLNGLMGMTEMLESEINSPQSVKYFEIIKSCEQSVLRIVNDFLDFSKMKAGKLRLEESNFNLRKVIENSISLYSFAASQKDITIDLFYDLALTHVYTDMYRFNQVLNNLLNNAIKFTESGKISVTVECQNSSMDKPFIILRVKDSGVGIDDENAKKLFTPFEQLDSSSTRRSGGTGLGLVISQGIAQSMGGDLRVNSSLGEGAEFVFSFQVSQPRVDQKKVTPETSFPKERNFKNLKILVADDNKVNQLVAKKMLEKLGLQVDLADTGKAALDAFEQKVYDIVFMDGHMPEMDGYEATRKIRGKKGLSKQPHIIAFTANTSDADKKNCFDSGMDDFMAKPISINSIEGAIHRAVTKEVVQ